MLVKTIYVDSPSKIRYGTTKKPPETTMGEVIALLKKHGCSKVAMASDLGEDGETNRIAFELDKVPYMLDVPRVYIRKGRGYTKQYEYNDMIGIRLVYYFLQTMLEMVKNRIVDIKFLMLPSMVVNTPAFAEAVKEEKIELGSLMQGLDRKALEESEE